MKIDLLPQDEPDRMWLCRVREQLRERLLGDEWSEVTDGTRAGFVTPERLVVVEGPGATPAVWKLRPLKKQGKDVSLLSLTIVPGENVIWAVCSDTFAVAQGRFVARLTWSAKTKTAEWGALKQPFPWSPYSHTGVFLECIGAATADTAFVSTFSQTTTALARIGKHPHPGVPIERGLATFGITPPSFVVVSTRKRRAAFYDAEGSEAESFALGSKVWSALGATPSALGSIRVAGRDLWLNTRTKTVHARLECDPPALVVPLSRPVEKTKRPPGTMPKATYATVDPTYAQSRIKAQLVRFAERVKAWDLNETPAFEDAAPFALLVITDGALSFYKERDGKLRKSFDFMLTGIREMECGPPPKEAKAPKGVVLAKLRTYSGLTQVLCREAFASELNVRIGSKRSRA